MDFTDLRPTVGFDIGGTHCRAAVVTAGGEILETLSTATPATVEALEDTVVRLLDQLRATHDPAAVGLAVAGFLDPARETVRFAPHLPWRNAPVRARLAGRIGLPVTLEHDANSAAWGEYRFGAAQGAGTWVFFAVGTGIGATLMIDGEIFRGAHGTAPEFGHLTVVPGGRQCACGKRGCLERYASGTALVDTAAELAVPGAGGLARRVVEKRDAVTGAEIMAAARAGDPTGMAVLADFAGWLGRGLAMVTDVLDPELIVLGGGVPLDADLFLDAACGRMAEEIVGAGHRPLPVVGTAELGAHAGMIGVADLARGQM